MYFVTFVTIECSESKAERKKEAKFLYKEIKCTHHLRSHSHIKRAERKNADDMKKYQYTSNYHITYFKVISYLDGLPLPFYYDFFSFNFRN